MHGSSWRIAETHNGQKGNVNDRFEKQGFTWANGYALTNIFCSFPTRLRFNGECKVYYNSSVYFYEHNYQCRDILNTLGRLILKRKEG